MLAYYMWLGPSAQMFEQSHITSEPKTVSGCSLFVPVVSHLLEPAQTALQSHFKRRSSHFIE